MSAKRYKQKAKYFSEKVKHTKHKVQKSIALLCSAAVIATAVPIASMMSVGAQSAIYASTTDYLNMRKGAGMGYSVIKVIPKNTSVRVLSASSDWLKVRTSDGTEGYCSTDYLDITTNAKTTDYLNLRKGAGTNYSVIKTISPNVTLDVLKIINNSWAYIKLSDGTKGYVCTDYISYITSSSHSGNNSNTSNSNTVKYILKLSSTSLKIAVGKSATITADASSGGKVEWKSSNTKVATVSSGQIKGVSDGTATITATDTTTNLKAKCTVNVIKTDYTSITLSKTSESVCVGKNFTLTATTKPESDGKVNFKSSNTSVATVSDDGKVTAVSVGTATITAYDSTGLITAKCTVTVKEKDSISISKSSITVNEGSSVKITAKASDSSMKICWSSSNLNVAGVNNGVISGLRLGKATITASDETGKIKASCVVTVNAVSAGNITLSRYSASTTAGKTIYIKGYSSTSASWETSDSSIATVSKGLIATKKPGRVAITYSDNSGHKAVCVVTVNDAAPVRFAYSSPNSAILDSDVTLVAITDKTRQKVRFEVDMDGEKVLVDATSKTADGSTYVWKGKIRVTSAGIFNVKAYSYSDGIWRTCTDGKTDIYVSSKTNSDTTGLDRLRASDNVIKFIGEKEGFVSSVTYDTLANNIPTLGHGYVVWEGQQFYNNLTENEGYALLVDAVNNDSYTSKVNDMLISNKLRFNQRQFDALVSFSYNLGTGWTSSSDLKDILLNSIGTISSDTVLVGKVTTYDGLNLRSQPTTSSSVTDVLLYGEQVTLVSSEKYNNIWYKVKTSSGKTGYCSGTYLNITTTGEVGRDLNYVNRNALIREMLAYHHACGVCYYGLLYRRADELEMFLYGDYVADGRSNKHNFPNPSCISFP